MSWLVLTYSLPASERSSPRVAIWRRLNRLGTISPSGSAYVLPNREDCLESFQWITKEVQQQKGECLLMKVDSFEGLSDQQLVALFRDKSNKEYSELDESINDLEKLISEGSPEEELKLHAEIEKLRKRHAEILRTDFFDASGGTRIAARLSQLERGLGKATQDQPSIQEVSKKQFQGKVWVTRPRPHVDRLACGWLIRRFIDAKAKIKYSNDPAKDEIAFDMKEGGTFGHVGNLCTFETMMVAFDFNDPGLTTIAEIVHEIDLRDGRYLHPQTAGIDSILKGWLLKGLSDAELETHGIVLFDGLHADILRAEKSSKDVGKKR